MRTDAFNMNALKHDMHETSCDSACEGHELSADTQRRLHVLGKLHLQRNAIASEMRAEALALERKYAARFAVIDADRNRVVSGARDPTAEELSDYKGPAEQGAEEEKGIASFWTRVLRMHPSIDQTIEAADMEALSALRDIRTVPLADAPGFRLEFEFAPNAYFEETLLVKEYRLAEPEAELQAQSGRTDEYVYDSVSCTPITWKAGRNLCYRTVTRVQRHRTNNTTRTVKREEPTPSFFHFFTEPQKHAELYGEDDGNAAENLENIVDMDFAMGELIREAIVPDALNWFTGVAYNYADLDTEEDHDGESYGSYEGDEDDEDDDEDEDDESDESSEDEAPSRHRGAAFQAPPQQKPECKQQ